MAQPLDRRGVEAQEVALLLLHVTHKMSALALAQGQELLKVAPGHQRGLLGGKPRMSYIRANLYVGHIKGIL